MTDARNVYLIIFVMLLLPIVFYMLRRRYRSKDAKKRTRSLLYMGIMIIVAGGLCFGLYSHTIHTEPLLVAEQTACALYRTNQNGEEPAASLQAQSLLQQGAPIQQQGTGNWAEFAGADIKMPDKTIEIEGQKYYPIALDKDNTRLCIAMKMTKDPSRTKVQGIVIIWPEQIENQLDSVTYFDSGKLPQ